MSGTSEHDRLPDQAALDELSRAFGNEPSDEGGDDDPTRATPDGDAVEPVEPADAVEPAEPVDPAEPVEPADDPAASVTGQVAALESTAPVVPPQRRTIVIGADDFPGADERRVVPPLDVPRPPGADRPTVQPQPSEPAAGGPAVITIADDDLPDAVTIDGTLDPNSKRPVVIIEGALDGDEMAPASDREVRRGIEPRMRERRLSVKRAQTRKRLKWVALGLLVVTVVVGGLALLGSSLFAVKADQIDVVGAVYTDDDELQRIIDDLADTPALRVDVGRLEAELEAIPWVERAEVTVDFPSAATIDIRERQPMTTYQGPDGRYRVLDRGGRVLDVIDGYPFAYVLITGPDPVDLDPGEFAPRGYAAASELARNLTPPVRGRVATLEVAADGSSLDMILDDGRLVRFGEARELFAKLVRLDRVLTSGQELADGPIDVSTEEVTVPLASGEDG